MFPHTSDNDDANSYISHGRDHTLRVWRLNPADEENVEKSLPIDEPSGIQLRDEPWLLHSLSVNTMNFCPFSMCSVPLDVYTNGKAASSLPETQPSSFSDMFVAVPNAMNTGGIDIFHIPSERRISTIPADADDSTGMAMGVKIFVSPEDKKLYVISCYENGSAMVHSHRGSIRIPCPGYPNGSNLTWEKLYGDKSHSQPVLSLDLPSTKRDHFFTSSADSMLVKHPIPRMTSGDVNRTLAKPLKGFNTKHSGQQGLKIRSDSRIFVTAGWDGKARVYSCKTLKELAVLKGHVAGCYTTAIADVDIDIGSQQGSSEHANTTDASDSQQGSSVSTRDAQSGSLAAIKDQRRRRAQFTHWIAVGSKDCRISLWDVY